MQLYWGGTRRLAAEAEPEGYVALERTIAFGSLPARVQAKALAMTPRSSITLVEEVRTPTRRLYEIYYRRNGRPAKAEFDARP